MNYNASYSPRDLVHDSYLIWHKGTGTGLFDKDERLVRRVIKNAYYNILDRGYLRRDGEKIKRQTLVISDGYSEEKEEGPITPYFIPREDNTPEDFVVYEDILENLTNSLSEFDKKVLDLKLEGYTYVEIKDILKSSTIKITTASKNIRNLMHTKSPFNGCKVIVVKRVKRSTFEESKEEYLKDWEMGEDSDSNEFFVLMTSKTNPSEGLLIKEKGSD